MAQEARPGSTSHHGMGMSSACICLRSGAWGLCETCGEGRVRGGEE
jgi:hypothetical protein